MTHQGNLFSSGLRSTALSLRALCHWWRHEFPRHLPHPQHTPNSLFLNFSQKCPGPVDGPWATTLHRADWWGYPRLTQVAKVTEDDFELMIFLLPPPKNYVCATMPSYLYTSYILCFTTIFFYKNHNESTKPHLCFMVIPLSIYLLIRRKWNCLCLSLCGILGHLPKSQSGLFFPQCRS